MDWHAIKINQSYSAVYFLIIASTAIKILVILRHNFKLEVKAKETACRVWEVGKKETLSDQNWFKHLTGADLTIELNPRSVRLSIFDYNF